MTRIFVIGLMALSLAGCGSDAMRSFTFMQGTEKPIARDVMPRSFKQEIVYVIPSVVADQRGIREAYYSDPVIDPKLNTYVSCVRFNARNALLWGTLAGSTLPFVLQLVKLDPATASAPFVATLVDVTGLII